MHINQVNNLNFGMAQSKGRFRDLEIDALMASQLKGPRRIAATKGNIETIARCFDGVIRMKKMSDTDVVVLRRDSSPIARLFGDKRSEHILHVIKPKETAINILDNVADKIEREYSLFTGDKLRITQDDIRQGFSGFVDSVNNLYKKGRTKQILAAIRNLK